MIPTRATTRLLLQPSSRVGLFPRAVRLPARRYATANEPPKQESPSKNPAANFYKTFTRPVAKVLLVAVLTYQLVYWSWMKLETDEIRAETAATIADLEAKVDEYKKTTASDKSK